MLVQVEILKDFVHGPFSCNTKQKDVRLPQMTAAQLERRGFVRVVRGEFAPLAAVRSPSVIDPGKALAAGKATASSASPAARVSPKTTSSAFASGAKGKKGDGSSSSTRRSASRPGLTS